MGYTLQGQVMQCLYSNNGTVIGKISNCFRHHVEYLMSTYRENVLLTDSIVNIITCKIHWQPQVIGYLLMLIVHHIIIKPWTVYCSTYYH